MEAYNSRDNICKFHDFVPGHGRGEMAKIRETPKKINFLLSINSKWPPRSKSCCLKGGVYKRAGSPRRSKFIEIDVLLMCMCNFNIIVFAYITLYISPVKIFWCVKYYKAQPYNMEHTLCVCVSMT